MAQKPYPRSPHGKDALYTIALPEFGIPYVTEAEFNTKRTIFVHSHPEIQTFWIVRGKFFVHFANCTFELNPGSVCVIPGGLKHRVSQDPRAPHVRFIDIRICEGPFAKYLAEFGGQQEFRMNPALLRSCDAELRKVHGQIGPQKTSRVMGILWRMLGALSQPEAAGHERESNGDRRLELADGYMKDALAGPLDVETVAEYVELSRSQLTRLYLRHKKISPAHRLRQLRVEKSMHLLTNSALNVKEIASACGFVCPNHFCRIFRLQTRKTPSQYREMMMKANT
jgi:AraC-like DNA-binding protein